MLAGGDGCVWIVCVCVGGGGWGASALFDDMYSYDPVARVWTQLYTDNTPSARYGHGFVFAVGRLWCQGGYGFIAQTDGYGDSKHTRCTLKEQRRERNRFWCPEVLCAWDQDAVDN